jgi:ABC-type transport system involved in multi-copper enzyme maturation permease subunit
VSEKTTSADRDARRHLAVRVVLAALGVLLLVLGATALVVGGDSPGGDTALLGLRIGVGYAVVLGVGGLIALAGAAARTWTLRIAFLLALAFGVLFIVGSATSVNTGNSTPLHLSDADHWFNLGVTVVALSAGMAAGARALANPSARAGRRSRNQSGLHPGH